MESERHTAGLAWIESVPDAALVVSSTGHIVATNQALLDLFGYATSDLVGQRIEMLVPEANREAHRAQHAGYMRSPSRRPMGSGLRLHGRARDGMLIPVEISLSPDTTSEATGVVTVVRDIRDRLRQEQLVQDAHEQIALATDRERIARDLHDTVIQEVYATALTLQSLIARVPAEVATRLNELIDRQDATIKQLRGAIFGLAQATAAAKGLQLTVLEMAEEATRALGFRPDVRLTGPLDVVSREVRPHVLAVLRESISNIARHADATEVVIDLSADHRQLTLRVADNGKGLDTLARPSGRGLQNIADRAHELGGTSQFTTGPDGGTELVWSVPLQPMGS